MTMPDRLKTLLLLGAPGSGKGTQGKTLGTIPGFFHCACGDVFRNLDADSELGKIFYSYSTRGELVPDDVTVRMWDEAIKGRMATREYVPERDLLILDGIPRTAAHAAIMDQHIEPLKVVHLACSDQEAMIDRLRRRALKENRLDDADESVIRNRWEVYEKETHPVLAHYPASLIAEVDAIGTPIQILEAIVRVVEPIQAAHYGTYAD